MGIYSFKKISPKIKDEVFIAPSSDIIGDVRVDKGASIWFNTTLRGDKGFIGIGRNTNIQDNCVLHGSDMKETLVGDNVTVGHNSVVHSCIIGDNCLIGMGSVILDDVIIPDNCIVGAGSLVTKGKVFCSNKLIMGSPAKEIRDLTDEEIDQIKENCKIYLDLSYDYINQK